MGYPDFQEENTLAGLITAALQSAGIPVVSNPVTRYNILAPPPAGVPGPWGVTAFGGGQTNEQAIQTFDSTVKRAAQAMRVYFTDNGTNATFANSSQFPGDLAAAFALGLIAIVSYLPAFSGTTGPNNLPSPAQMQADQNAMKASLNSIIAAGFPAGNLRVAMHHEANFQPRGISAAQYLNLYNGIASGGQSNYQALHAICPVYSIMLGNQPPTSSQITSYPPITPTLAANACDALLVDWYAKPYTKGQWLGGSVPGGQHTWDSVARAANVPLGLGEWGGLATQTLATIVQYLLSAPITISGTVYPGDPVHSMEAVFAQRLLDGLTNAEVCVFWDYGSNPSLPAGSPAVIAALHDALQTAATSSIGPGQSQVLKPVGPSPVAGYATAAGMSYDVIMNAIAAVAGSTNPWLAVTMNWYNDDSLTALPVATQKWSVPIGPAGSVGTFISGVGPQAGKYWSITVTNNDTVSAIFSLQGNSTGRVTQRHDWRWDSPDSAGVPTYTLPGGDGNGLSLGSINGGTVGAGNTKAWLLSMFAGQVVARISVSGVTGTSTVAVSLKAQPSGRWGTANIWSASLPDANLAPTNEAVYTLALPRAPCLFSVTNNDANTATINAEFIAIEPG